MRDRIPRRRTVVPLLVAAALAFARVTPAAPPVPGSAAPPARGSAAGVAPRVEAQFGPGVARIRRAAATLRDWASERGGEVGVAVLDPASGTYLARVAAEKPRNPASNAKIFTAAVALHRLGPQHRFVTGLFGKLEGNTVGELVLRGTGDPSLTTGDLAELARAVAAMGLRRVAGRVLLDDTRFDGQTVPPAFDQQPNEWASFRAPVSAVAVDRNSLTAHVRPGRPGEPARTWFDPPGLVTPIGTFTTGPAGSGQDLRIDWRERPDGVEARLAGEVATGLPTLEFTRRLDDPTLTAGRVLVTLLRREGIEVGDNVALGGATERRRLATHTSAPLAQLVADLGKASDNFCAEMLFKSLGAGANGEKATFARAAAVVTEWIHAAGVPTEGLRIVNGSGLFDANRASAATLAEVLSVALRDPAIGGEFVAQLAIGGVDGTLAPRFRALRAARSVRAKTGTLARVDALSGYAYPPGRSLPLVFSILVEGIGEHAAARQRIDRLVEAIVDIDAAAPPQAGSAAP